MKRHCTVTAISAITLLAGTAGAQEPSGAPPQPAVSVSLGGSAAASGPAAEANPAADKGAAAPTDEEVTDPKPANYEFGFVTVGANQAWNLVGKWLFFGAGGGLGPPLYRYGKIKGHPTRGWNNNLDIVYGNLFLRIAPVKYVDLDFGPKISLGATLWDVPDAPESAFSYGGYVDLRIGSRTVKLGPRFEYMRIAHSSFYDTAWMITPLMARVVH